MHATITAYLHTLNHVQTHTGRLHPMSDSRATDQPEPPTSCETPSNIIVYSEVDWSVDTDTTNTTTHHNHNHDCRLLTCYYYYYYYYSYYASSATSSCTWTGKGGAVAARVPAFTVVPATASHYSTSGP